MAARGGPRIRGRDGRIPIFRLRVPQEGNATSSNPLVRDLREHVRDPELRNRILEMVRRDEQRQRERDQSPPQGNEEEAEGSGDEDSRSNEEESNHASSSHGERQQRHNEGSRRRRNQNRPERIMWHTIPLDSSLKAAKINLGFSINLTPILPTFDISEDILNNIAISGLPKVLNALPNRVSQSIVRITYGYAINLTDPEFITIEVGSRKYLMSANQINIILDLGDDLRSIASVYEDHELLLEVLNEITDFNFERLPKLPMKISLLNNPIWRFLTHVVTKGLNCQVRNTSTLSQEDLAMLAALYKGIKIDFGHYFVANINKVAASKREGKILLHGRAINFIVQNTVALGDLSELPYESCPSFDLKALKRMNMAKDKGKWRWGQDHFQYSSAATQEMLRAGHELKGEHAEQHEGHNIPNETHEQPHEVHFSMGPPSHVVQPQFPRRSFEGHEEEYDFQSYDRFTDREVMDMILRYVSADGFASGFPNFIPPPQEPIVPQQPVQSLTHTSRRGSRRNNEVRNEDAEASHVGSSRRLSMGGHRTRSHTSVGTRRSREEDRGE